MSNHNFLLLGSGTKACVAFKPMVAGLLLLTFMGFGLLGCKVPAPPEGAAPEASPEVRTVAQDAAPVQYGDVMMRSLRVWPRGDDDERDTLATAKAFHVNRIVWIYENTREYNDRVRAEGIGIGTTMAQNAREQWFNDMTRQEREAFVERFTMVNLEGEQVLRRHRRGFGGNPWITHFEPDQSNPEWLAFYADYVATLYEQGIDTLHRDDPRLTWGATRAGGTFTDSIVAFFQTYLVEHFTAAELAELGVDDPATFNVRDLFKALGAPTDDTLWAWRGSPLMPVFQEALSQVDRQFFVDLKAAVEERAGFSIPWSANGNGPVQPHEAAFDFRVGEFQSHHNQPQTILLLNEYPRQAGKIQAFVSIVDRNWETLDSFVPDLRRHIPSAYASGAIPLVPWCMYMHAAPRYYGTVEDFGDLYHFVSAYRNYFNGHELVSVSGIDNRARLYSWMPNREMLFDHGDPSARVWINQPNVIGYVRQAPDAKHTVVHLVDWNNRPGPIEVSFDPQSLVGSSSADVQVLRPAAEPLTITAYQGQTLELPALDPWGLLVVTPSASPKSGLPAPRLIAPMRGVVSADAVATFAKPGEGQIIVARFLPDGGEGEPEFVALRGEASLAIPTTGVLEAMTRQEDDGQESAVMRVRFETFKDYGVDAHEWAGREGIDLSSSFRTASGEMKVNESFLADTMQLMGATIERGFSTQGDVNLVVPLEAGWEIFTVRVGIDDAEDRRPCARFQVRFDGELAYETPIINPTKAQLMDEDRREFSITVRIPDGTERLQLRAINGGFFEDQNHFIWAEPTVYGSDRI